MTRKELLESPFRLGERVPGTEWVVTDVLGRGGMGLVLEVRKDPGIVAAIKILLTQHARNPDVLRRFKDEVAVLAKLDHPHIVKVLDWGTIPDGRPYMVMERLRGHSLRHVAQERLRAGRRIPARMIYEIVRQVCEGLQRAHAHAPPVVHRDLKPDNLFLHYAPFSDNPVMKVIDFGVAEVLGEASRAAHGQTIGTPRYMSPEVLRGDLVTPAADLYAMALVVYELLTIRLPWAVDGGNVLQWAELRLREPPTPPSTLVPWIPKSVDECLLRALSQEPGARHESVYAFGRALYELQFASDGSSYASLDADTTAPSLATLALGSGEGDGDASSQAGDDTVRSDVASVEVVFDADERGPAVMALAESTTSLDAERVAAPEPRAFSEPGASGARPGGATELATVIPPPEPLAGAARRATRRRVLPAIGALSRAATAAVALVVRDGAQGAPVARPSARATAEPSASAAWPRGVAASVEPAALAAPVAIAVVGVDASHENGSLEDSPTDVAEVAHARELASDLPNLGIAPVPPRPAPEAGIGAPVVAAAAPAARVRPPAAPKPKPRPRDDGYELLSGPR